MGASLILLAVPGPCTTFNGNEIEGGCDAGFGFAFTQDSAPGCEAIVNHACCYVLANCDSDCQNRLSCINQCTPPRLVTSTCVQSCIDKNTAFEDTLGSLKHCFSAATDASECDWLSPK
jgi:hypothetical protein